MPNSNSASKRSKTSQSSENSQPEPSFEDADVACERLKINRQTLYAYVSRGLIECTRHTSDSRKRLYASRDINALLIQNNKGRSRQAVASSTIDFGEPILKSSLSRIDRGRYFYRGIDAIELSRTATLEEVFELLCRTKIKAQWLNTHCLVRSKRRRPYSRFVEALADNVSNQTVYGNKRHAFQLLKIMALNGTAHRATGAANNIGLNKPIHQQLAESWSQDQRAPDLIRRALVLSADHELNASTYATRVTASAGANLAACLLTGISTLSGNLHGGLTDLCLKWIRRHTQAPTPSIAIAKHQSIPGFGHRLYPEGDPRPIEIMRHCKPPKDWQQLIRQVEKKTSTHPTLDLGLATLEHQLKLPKGAGFTIFAVGRTVGWLAHCFEQRENGTLIRPRAWPDT